ncbi:hypothetical protein [Burkholderia mayonis]|uniref:hypothetical protein n=1 Tax=Burkholderia mayonis TaxID=1385591 RepID=UPI000ACB2BDD|nr:hypothetical protein [Burkholderia mayonis]
MMVKARSDSIDFRGIERGSAHFRGRRCRSMEDAMSDTNTVLDFVNVWFDATPDAIAVAATHTRR